ncbi:MAG TPA: DHA2 family efflux MFS transporter permease subunit, partial [Mycobacteriales bacterium]|nr:DHA2 family efflux MFS transporter permease subunit [Mycobacteriales bacterium]
MPLADSPPPAGSAALLPDSPGRPPINKNLALLVLAVAQLMVVLDITIVNVALPDIARALEVTSNADLQWVVTGYTLTFGGFLLLGGKLADRLGRKLVFNLGAALFAVASLVGGLAGNLEVLLMARAVQGIGGALMSPAALSLITVLFEEGKERNRALGIYAAITAGGAAIGLIAGGFLTEYASWRWVFFVNLPIAAVAIVGALLVVPESRDEDAQGFDVAGAVLVTSGLMALVYGLVKGNDNGWTSLRTLGVLGLAVALLAAFVVVQRRVRFPLMPFRIFRTRSVLGADIGALLVGAGIFAIFFFLILWMQQVNGYSPVKSGLAFLPMTVLIGVSAGIGAQLLGRIGPRPLLTAGPALGAVGLVALGLRLEPDSSYLTVVLPSLALVAIGMGMTFVALTSCAVAGVPDEDVGIASALLNAGQQVG